MPLYRYKCPACGASKEVFKDMAEYDLPELCDADSFVMYKDFMTKHRKGFASTYPMTSNAAGVAPKQAREATEHATSIGVPTHFNSDGDPEFTSKKHRKDYCEKVGLYDRNGGYSDPQRK